MGSSIPIQLISSVAQFAHICTLRTAMAFGKVVALLFAVCVAVAFAAPEAVQKVEGAAPEPQTKGFAGPLLGHGFHGYAPYAGFHGFAYGHPGYAYGHGFHGAYWG